jgi:hypothetical protein
MRDVKMRVANFDSNLAPLNYEIQMRSMLRPPNSRDPAVGVRNHLSLSEGNQWSRGSFIA